MKRKSARPPPDDKAQSERFVETARALESDESGKPFAEAFKKILPKKWRAPKRKPD